MARAWPDDWDDRRRGAGCPMCGPAPPDDTTYGARIFEGTWSVAYLGRAPVRHGYTFVVWNGGRHVTEPTELTAEEAAGFWDEVGRVARAVEARYRPVKMNWLSLGNGVPHLHVHLVPRHADDDHAGGPIEAEAFAEAEHRRLDDETLLTEAAALQALLA